MTSKLIQSTSFLRRVLLADAGISAAVGALMVAGAGPLQRLTGLPATLLLVGGTAWRWRYDQFGWTTRSSQVYESRLLRIGSPLFHFGILVVAFGHVIGLLVPKSWTDAAGLSQEAYHVQALALGGIAGVATVVGVAILVYRRRTTGPVFSATTRNDKAMYVLLIATLVLGLTTIMGPKTGTSGIMTSRSSLGRTWSAVTT